MAIVSGSANPQRSENARQVAMCFISAPEWLIGFFRLWLSAIRYEYYVLPEKIRGTLESRYIVHCRAHSSRTRDPLRMFLNIRLFQATHAPTEAWHSFQER